MKDKRIWDGWMTLRITENMKVLAIEPKAGGYVRFEFHLQDARSQPGIVTGSIRRLREGILPRGRPAPRAVGHRFAESDLNFVIAGWNVFGSSFRNGFDHHRSDGINVQRGTRIRWSASERSKGSEELSVATQSVPTNRVLRGPPFLQFSMLLVVTSNQIGNISKVV